MSDFIEVYLGRRGRLITWWPQLKEDILGAGVLESNEAIDINFDDGTGYCKFDFKVTFADGDEGVLSDVNVCEVGSVSID